MNDGTIYDGEWKEGTQHGNGKLIYPNGVVENTQWKYGKRIDKN